MAEIRIISGIYGGRRIKTLDGNSTRPTTDRIREAWASSLAGMLTDGFVGLNVVDVFAGSGALGLEALSRGARHIVFCEKNKSALDLLKVNIARLNRAAEFCKTYGVDVFSSQLAARLKGQKPFDLMILDPPYACPYKDVLGLIRTMHEQSLLAKGCLISYEHNKFSDHLQDEFARTLADGSLLYELISTKRYGLTQIDYISYHGI